MITFEEWKKRYVALYPLEENNKYALLKKYLEETGGNGLGSEPETQILGNLQITDVNKIKDSWKSTLANNVFSVGLGPTLNKFDLPVGNNFVEGQAYQPLTNQTETQVEQLGSILDKDKQIEEENKKRQLERDTITLDRVRNVARSIGLVTGAINSRNLSSFTNFLDYGLLLGIDNAEGIGKGIGKILGGEAGAAKGANIAKGVSTGFQIASLGADIMKAAGINNDEQTGFDKFANSRLGKITFVGIVNDLFGKRSKNFSTDTELLEQMGGAYSGSYNQFAKALEKAGKKFGLFSSGARNDANELIADSKKQLFAISNINKDTRDRQAIVANTSQLLSTNYAYNLNGGYDLKYMRAAKEGGTITRIKKLNISFNKAGGQIHNIINLDTKEIEWVPVILPPEEETVEVFKEGGQFSWNYDDWEPEIIQSEWEPEIIDELPAFKEGGKTEENEETLVDTTLKNVIPEGALHAHKHHMDNDEHITKKGIPVIDNDGSQLAEIELNEIIFSLEVTKKIEEYYKDGSDEAAIACGKLLVELILNNTEDRTGLIDSLKLGGKIDGCS